MTKTSVQAAIHERVDPVLEAMIYGLVESASRPQPSAQTGDPITQALAFALAEALITPPSPRPARPGAGVTPLESALTYALAVALAPALAQSLVPAIVQALGTVAAKEKPAEERPGQEKPEQESATSGSFSQ
jgi:hypothetical protein